jgi:hypothetical protein
MLDLDTTTSNATIEAPTAHGLYNGIQTFRQLLPPWINRAKAGPGPWTTPVVTITDHPRYQYRGVLLDIARHYESPSAVEELIDQVAAYKVNVFHLHLSDDAGNPALPADPHGIDCGQSNPPQWDYTEDVGYSALCPDSPDTWLPDQHADHVRLVAGHRVHDQLGRRQHQHRRRDRRERHRYPREQPVHDLR